MYWRGGYISVNLAKVRISFLFGEMDLLPPIVSRNLVQVIFLVSFANWHCNCYLPYCRAREL